MFLRSTNNGLAAGLDATSLPSHSDKLSPSTSANAEVFRPSCCNANGPLLEASGQADVPSPAFLVSVVAAVNQALAAEKTPTSVAASSRVAGGVPATFSSSLQSQAAALAVSGAGFPPVSASTAGAVSQVPGTPNFVVPSFFLNFFAAGTFSRSFAFECRDRASPHRVFLFTNRTCFTAVVCGGTWLFARPTKTSEPDCIWQIHGTKRIALVEHCSNTIRLGSSIVSRWAAGPHVQA